MFCIESQAFYSFKHVYHLSFDGVHAWLNRCDTNHETCHTQIYCEREEGSLLHTIENL
jgi:hypothetical protein